MASPLVVACGAINWDVTLFVPHLPAPGEEVPVREVAQVPGGTGANVAVAAARLLGRGRVAFAGAVGQDDVGRAQRAILEGEGVATQGLLDLPDAHSGHAYITVDPQGQNVIASALGANLLLRPEHLGEPAVQELLRSAQVYAVTDPPLEVVEALLGAASQTGARVLWDPGVYVQQGWQALAPLARRVDTLLLNEVEAGQLVGEAAPRAVARKLLEDVWRNRVALKQGARGAVLLDLGARRLISTPALPLAALGLQVVSTVGCGDAFQGALASVECLGYRGGEALALAACAGGLKATRPGTRDVPSWPELEAAFARWQALGIGLREERL